VLSSTIHELLHFFLAVITSPMCFNKTFHRVCSRPRIIAYKIKMLSVKYIYKSHLINNGYNKKKSYYLLCMRDEHNGATSMHGNRTMNMSVLISPLECDGGVKCMDVTCWMCSAYTTFETYEDLNLSKPPRHSNLEALFLSHILFAFFYASYQ